jgi:hypothetical protein
MIIKENGTEERTGAAHQNKGSHSMILFTVLFIGSFVKQFFKGANNNVYDEYLY